MPDETHYGVAAAEAAMSSRDRWPRIKPQDGERVRFHFLTDGSDPWLVGTKFHKIGEFPNSRDIVCTQALSQGNEACGFCDMDSTNRRNMFACWIWTEFILHPHDNPDEEGEAWEQKQLALPNGRKLAVFKEDIKKPQLLWLPAGKQKAWWSQFTTAWMTSGNLRRHFYELHRIGGGRDDTNYILTTVKEDPLADDILQLDEVKNLPNIEDIFRETLRFTPTTGLLGTDSLDGATPEDLPTVSTTAASTADDDLI